MTLFLNPIIVSIVLMIVLCLLRTNIFVSIILSSAVCGSLGGGTIFEIIDVFAAGMSGNNSLVLSLLLFSIVVEGINYSGIGMALVPRLSALAGNRKWLILLLLFLLAVLSESVFMLGPTFVSIAIPPLLSYTDELRIDRRCIAVAVIGGLQLGYSCVLFGFGLAFHQIIEESTAANGLTVAMDEIWQSMQPFAFALLAGVDISLLLYGKPRDYNTENLHTESKAPTLMRKHWATLLALAMMVIIQFFTTSLPLGAVSGIALLLLLRVIPWHKFDSICIKGFEHFGTVAFILMAAAGFAAVFREYGQIDTLVAAVSELLGGSRSLGSLSMLLLGLAITIGLGSGFASVSIISTLVVPICAQMGFTASDVVLLIGSAAALGDGIAPASSQTLLPTAALNTDGAHDHIRDTCIPIFLCYAFPAVAAIIISTIIQ